MERLGLEKNVGSGSKDGVDLIVSHLRIFVLLLRQTDPEMLNMLRVILEDAEMHDESTEMEFKIMFLPWVLTWFSAVIIPEPTAELFEVSARAPRCVRRQMFAEKGRWRQWRCIAKMMIRRPRSRSSVSGMPRHSVA